MTPDERRARALCERSLRYIARARRWAPHAQHLPVSLAGLASMIERMDDDLATARSLMSATGLLCGRREFRRPARDGEASLAHSAPRQDREILERRR